MTTEKIKTLLQRYLDGKASPAEAKQVEEWYAQINLQDHQLSNSQKGVIRERIFQHLEAAMQQPVRTRKYYIHLFSGIAAACFIVCLLGLGIWKSTNYENTGKNLITVETAEAESRKISLNDGSQILLGPLAKLTYPAKFSKDRRSVYLEEGSALFNIAHEAGRPFNVRTYSGVNVRVLGTSFSVRAYKSKPAVQVSVLTGKVKVNTQKGSVATLIKDQQLSYDKRNGLVSIHKVKEKRFIRLFFEGAKLQQLCQRLEYLYSIQILIKDPAVTSLKTTANFTSAQQPEEILDIICSLHHLRFTRSDNPKIFSIYK